jgi:integrase
MGSVFQREKSERAKAQWVAKYRDASGKWRTKNLGDVSAAEAKRRLREIENLVDAGKPVTEPKVGTFGELLAKWLANLTNRNAKHDNYRGRRHLLPPFGRRRVEDIDLRAILEWLEDMSRANEIAPRTQLHNFRLLSRFLGWAVERGYVPHNPCRDVSVGRRPRASARLDTPWLDDDGVVVRLYHALPEPINLMFYVGNRSGLRTGELCGLRMSDLAYLPDCIRVRHSYDGPLKEDKHGDGKTKWVPAPVDARDVLGSYLAKRVAEGAGPEDFVFVRPTGGGYTASQAHVAIGWHWHAALRSLAAEGIELSLTWYQATRHSFVSRNLSAGASLDEVSAAVGHSSPAITQRHYNHFVRKTFSPTLTRGLGLGTEQGGKILPLKKP